MKYHQRDIVEVSFLFPDGTFKPHPAIIISNDELQLDEDGMIYLVLITSNDTINPQYSYPLTDEMLISHTFSKPSLVKCQIISGYVERDVTRRLGSIKLKYFNEIVDKVIESIF
ncbi:MAG: type II toxin-antitoxin system PemK/MazF family toxin [Prevotella sp.]|nr:type II toxin-antitoxin system PemK/MazF family toxin [Prevotella sp.]MBR5062522.1 type II toxin-antitoxin system PemK/MazF family toxin [Prevotella sp.]